MAGHANNSCPEQQSKSCFYVPQSSIGGNSTPGIFGGPLPGASDNDWGGGAIGSGFVGELGAGSGFVSGAGLGGGTAGIAGGDGIRLAVVVSPGGFSPGGGAIPGNASPTGAGDIAAGGVIGMPSAMVGGFSTGVAGTGGSGVGLAPLVGTGGLVFRAASVGLETGVAVNPSVRLGRTGGGGTSRRSIREVVVDSIGSRPGKVDGGGFIGPGPGSGST